MELGLVGFAPSKGVARRRGHLARLAENLKDLREEAMRLESAGETGDACKMNAAEIERVLADIEFFKMQGDRDSSGESQSSASLAGSSVLGASRMLPPDWDSRTTVVMNASVSLSDAAASSGSGVQLSVGKQETTNASGAASSGEKRKLASSFLRGGGGGGGTTPNTLSVASAGISPSSRSTSKEKSVDWVHDFNAEHDWQAAYEFWALLASVEARSEHPLARSLLRHARETYGLVPGESDDVPVATKFETHPGRGSRRGFRSRRRLKVEVLPWGANEVAKPLLAALSSCRSSGVRRRTTVLQRAQTRLLGTTREREDSRLAPLRPRASTST